jgi:D-glycero-D-manno-heptose 1,7-bisphosphate phosphatase
MTQKHPAIFFDRDGVLIETNVRNGKPYAITTVAELAIFPDALKVIQRFKSFGYKIIVVTNQPDVGNGLVAQSVVEEINSILLAKLPIDLIKVCYHNQQAGCECRKPKSGMLTEAAAELNLDLNLSVMIGDRASDIVAGNKVGCFTTLIDYGYNEPLTVQPDLKVSSLTEILQHKIGKVG